MTKSLDKYNYPFTILDSSEVTLEEGERLYRIHTGNPMDEIYIVRPASQWWLNNAISDDDFQEYVRCALRGKYGKRGWHMLTKLEDVTECMGFGG